ncbi:murein hydrolase activator EnvC family protein [Sphingosinicella sp. LY1275]|uniref:murein hydrolase activator EnvC family protein n=1 Tax=Sphingosinicella sp. LY1275 TaxID=3095379 RepID=UPI002ADED62F|nr:peptidoglycan DD-metalloendopeptidase family protein [Sphingosinicella sp. LY1275]MEA1015380.1 peptidoglycan DD-metalloendopeptidase family protein [Sphingosinicella sp. LY1275]
MRLALPALLFAALAGGVAVAQVQAASEAQALAQAKREAAEAMSRSVQLEDQAAKAVSEAAKARAASAATAARIQAAEAEITAAEARIRIIEGLRAEQRARLAERQGPVVRLTAALQTMARRPPALALVQPGSLNDVVRVRSLLASTLPVIRARTAALRAEVEKGNALRRQADLARTALVRSQDELKAQRIAFARLEASQRARSQSLTESALFESDRALALGEEARSLAALMDTLDYQAGIRRSLSGLPGPALRPGAATAPAASPPPAYRVPVEGRVVTGMGEISDAGVHARGLTFETPANSAVVAPRGGRVAYAGPFRDYGAIVILDHGGGWTTLVTDLASVRVRVGQRLAAGDALGRTGSARSRVTVELRRNGQPVAIAPLVALGG